MPDQIIGIIPARYGSTRFPGKPLFSIQGKTLLQRTYENAYRASSLNRLIIATDDDRIFDHVKGFGGEVIMTSVACPTGTDRLAEVLHKQPSLMKAQVIVNIQGDEPCIDPIAINRVAHLLMEDREAPMATAVTKLRSEEEAKSPSIVKCVVDRHQNALYFSRTLIPSNKQQAFNPQIPYLRHLGLYAYRPDFVMTYQNLPATPLQMEEDLEQLKVLEHGYRIKVAFVDHESIGVDTPEDIKKVEQWICKQNSFL